MKKKQLNRKPFLKRFYHKNKGRFCLALAATLLYVAVNLAISLLMQQLIDGGAISQQKFSVDPRPLDKNVPANFLQNFVFNNFMYSRQ